jgi:DpnII restriction endonuclease
MKRHTQRVAELKEQLGEVKTDWKDARAHKFIDFLMAVPNAESLDESTIVKILERDFEEAKLYFRLIFEQSDDEFDIFLRSIFTEFPKGAGKMSFKKDKQKYVSKLIEYGLIERYSHIASKDFTWKDILLERLKGGRGSAVKGQTRGRNLENFVQTIVETVYGDKFEARESFIGKDREKKAKADFCIPNKDQPRIVIEVKAYGATGSKQSDVIGDIEKIIKEKRSDTHFLLVTDGVTWLSRTSDFERLIRFQNEGHIYRIYTQKMEKELLSDLRELEKELGIE